MPHITIFESFQDRSSWVEPVLSRGKIKCLAQGYNAVPPVRLEPTTPQSWAKHSTNFYCAHFFFKTPFNARSFSLSQLNLWENKAYHPFSTIHLKNTPISTLCLLVLAADNLCKQFRPRTGRQNVWPDLDPNCLKYFFSKLMICKNQQITKSMKKYPTCKELNRYASIHKL